MNINHFNAINFGVGETKEPFKQSIISSKVSSAEALQFLDRNQEINDSFSSGLYDRIQSSLNDFQHLNTLS